jgi:hypothetical protein
MRPVGSWSALAAALAALTFASCASSSGGGITGSGIVIGPITGFGSIFVQGIEFDVSDAAVTIEGAPGGETDLRLGMLVEVRGSIAGNSGVASSVAFENQIRGTVEQVDAGTGTIVVLGQIVLAGPTTVFENTTLETLAPGDFAEVSGFSDGDGNVRATRIEKSDAADDVEISGFIGELDTGAQTFRIGGQLVDYSGAEIEGAPNGGLADGLFVEVTTAQPLSGGVLLADRVEVQDEGFDGEEGDDVEIEGVVSRVISSSEFVLNATRRVRITAQTQIAGGDAGDIVVNRELHAKGMLDAQSVLVATEIELED